MPAWVRWLLIPGAALGLLAPPAAAAPPTLHDITLQVFWQPEPNGRTQGPCEHEGTSTLRYAVTGSPDGTGGRVVVSEEGTVTIGEHTLAPLAEDGSHWIGTWFLRPGRIVRWESEFTIDATAWDGTTVTGTREGTELVDYDHGLCREFAGMADADDGHRNTVGYRRYVRAIRLAYEARLTRDGETVTERGTSEVNLREAYLDGDPGARVGQYRTTFAATGEAPVAEPTDAIDGADVTTDEEPSGQGPGGDGATTADPIEATLEEGAATEVSIAEETEPVAEASAKRSRRLGQRVKVTARSSAAAARLRFEIDSSARRSTGPRKLVVLRNRRTVPACATGRSPCVERRGLSGGDDALIVVRGRSLGGVWSFRAPRR